MSITILGIESSCDDTSAAVYRDGYLLSNLIAGQEVHKAYGGVVPELASRAHQQHIVPVVDQALLHAGVKREELAAVAFTRGPGLLGSLLVGTSFAKGMSLASGIPLIGVHHLEAHVLALFLRKSGEEKKVPEFPFLCLLVSGGHSQIMVVKDHLEMTVIGHSLDDAAGEAFDKGAKLLGLPYPGGPHIDRLAAAGDPQRFAFAEPKIPDLDFSFSGLKTSFLYFLREKVTEDPGFIKNNLHDLSAGLQQTIIRILLSKLKRAARETGINTVAVAGGVSANSALRTALRTEAQKRQWNLHIPSPEYTTDNAAMISITGYYKYKKGIFESQEVTPQARM